MRGWSHTDSVARRKTRYIMAVCHLARFYVQTARGVARHWHTSWNGSCTARPWKHTVFMPLTCNDLAWSIQWHNISWPSLVRKSCTILGTIVLFHSNSVLSYLRLQLTIHQPYCQGYVPLTLDVMRVAFKVPLAFHTPL